MRNKVLNMDCMKGMQSMPDNSVDFTLTDIPYDMTKHLNSIRDYSGGIRKINKKSADVLTFELEPFLEEVLRVTKGSILIFCGYEQFSTILTFFSKYKKGTVRPIIWQKSNPSPMNGKHIYLSGVELAVWYKPPGAVFNAFCKTNVFKTPQGSSKLFPTMKNESLWTELILDNTNEGDLVFDPCMGSGTTALCALGNNRSFYGFEINKDTYDLIQKRLSENILYAAIV